MLNSIYKISMKLGHIVCHQKPDRSFFVKNYQFPICARCTGITIGFTIALVLLYLKVYINLWLSLALTIVMCIDWLLQNLIIKKSNNIRRLITGLIGGFGISFLYYYIIICVVGFIQ